MKEYPQILEKLFQRHFLFVNLTNYFPVNGFCLSKFPTILCTNQICMRDPTCAESAEGHRRSLPNLPLVF